MRNFFGKIKFWISNPTELFKSILYRTSVLYPDKIFLKCFYHLNTGQKLNLDYPRGYNEKLQWMKLYYRKPEMVSLVDKIAVKEIVAERIGKEYVIPTLKTYSSVDEIRLADLPERFVLKTNNGGGNSGVVVCKDVSCFDFPAAKKKLKASLNTPMYPHTREWPYKMIKPAILAEEYKEDASGKELKDYKFFCFDGRVKVLFIGTERSTGDVKFDFYDREFNHLDIVQIHPMSGQMIQKPKNFDRMIEIAEKLSDGWPHVRVDLYNIDGQILFGEMTFFHHGGFVPFHPEKWDTILGDYIHLPEKVVE